MITQKHPRTPLDLEQWGRGYFTAAYSYGKNEYFKPIGGRYGFSGFGIAPAIPALISAGSSIFGAIFGNRGVSEAERQAMWMEFMEQQNTKWQTSQLLLYGFFPALAIIGGIMLLRK